MRISLFRLFLAFSKIGISAFGSTVVYARHVVVEEWRWMTEEEFLDTWALSQLVPGPNMVNWSVCAGARFRGAPGAAVAVLGLVIGPVCIALVLAALYGAYGDVPAVNAALHGIAAAATGLLCATAVKMAATPRVRSWMAIFAVLAFVAVGLLRVPLMQALALLIPLSIAGGMAQGKAGEAAMTDLAVLLQLVLDFSVISLLSIGGGVTTLPEMHRNAVERDAWLTNAQFSELYAIAQAAPGPTTTMFCALIGWKAAGPLGALVATSAILTPSCLITYFTATTWERFRNAPWHEMVQAGLIPVTVGLLFAAAWLVGEGAIHGYRDFIVAAVAAALMIATRISPLWLVAGGAMAGLAGFV